MFFVDNLCLKVELFCISAENKKVLRLLHNGMNETILYLFAGKAIFNKVYLREKYEEKRYG